MNYFKQYDRVIYNKCEYIIVEVHPSETFNIICPSITINLSRNHLIKAVNISDVELDKEYYREKNLNYY